jgi:hypothetical protein
MLVQLGSTIPLTKYSKRHSMYAVLLDLENIDQLHIIKFGYTNNIFRRLSSLKSEYRCNVFLVDIKIILSEQEEIDFHSNMKIAYPQLQYKCNIKGKRKDELYYLSDKLIDEYRYYESTSESINKENEENKLIKYDADENLNLKDDEVEGLKYFKEQMIRYKTLVDRRRLIINDEVGQFIATEQKINQTKAETKNNKFVVMGLKEKRNETIISMQSEIDRLTNEKNMLVIENNAAIEKLKSDKDAIIEKLKSDNKILELEKNAEIVDLKHKIEFLKNSKELKKK